MSLRPRGVIALLLAISLVLTACGRPAADQAQPTPPPIAQPAQPAEPPAVDPYAPRPAVSGVTTSESSGRVVIDANTSTVALQDDTRVDIPYLPDGSSLTVILEKQSSEVSLGSYDLETTGSMRVVTIDEVDIGAGATADGLLALSATITFPASEVGEIDLDTINMVRIGAVIEDGEIVETGISFLPVREDGDGNIVASDIYLLDAILAYHVREARVAGQAGDKVTALGTLGSSLLSPRVAQAAPTPDETAENKEVRITYALISCQGNLNWSRRPALVRMVPDDNDANKRRPLDSLSQDRREQELKKPVQNVIVFAHGRNEAEKGGDAALNDIGGPWFYSYKRDVWTHMYGEFLGKHKDLIACTVFYEFIYPTFRPIISPVIGEGNKTTLDVDFERLLREALSKQLDHDLEFNLLIVAHSMGGVVTRAGVQHLDRKLDSYFRNLLTWGTPHHGSPLVSLRYVMGLIGSIYDLNTAVSLPGLDADITRSVLYMLMRNAIGGFTIDTPGTQDLRWDGGPAEARIEVRLDDFFLTLVDPDENPGAFEWYNLIDGGHVYSHNLSSLNSNDRYKDANKYIFLYGLTSKRVLSRETTTLKAGPISINLPKYRRDMSEIAQGATLMPYMFREPERTVSGHPQGASDGAVPISSMVGGRLTGRSINLGDTDHEEYFGSPHGTEGYPKAFASPEKAVYTATETCKALGIGIKPEYNPPSLTVQPESFELEIVESETVDLSDAESIELSGVLTWPGDLQPGRRVSSTEGLLLMSRERLVPVQSYDIDAEGTFTVVVNPGDLIEEQIDQGTTTVKVPVQIRLVFKDRTELQSEETLIALTFTKAQAGLRLEPSVVSAEPGATVDFQAIVERYDRPVSFEWDFGDGKAPLRTTEPSAEYAYETKEEARYLVKVKMFDQAAPHVAIATAGATVYITEAAGETGRLAVFPKHAEVKVLRGLQFKALLDGAETTDVIWTIRETGTGHKVDQNTGSFSASHNTGSYHVVAQLRQDRSVTATAFVEVVPLGYWNLVEIRQGIDQPTNYPAFVDAFTVSETSVSHSRSYANPNEKGKETRKATWELLPDTLLPGQQLEVPVTVEVIDRVERAMSFSFALYQRFETYDAYATSSAWMGFFWNNTGIRYIAASGRSEIEIGGAGLAKAGDKVTAVYTVPVPPLLAGSVAQPKYLQDSDTWALRISVGALHHAYVDYVYRFVVDD